MITERKLIAEIRRLYSNIELGYTLGDFGLDVSKLLEREFSCRACGGDVAEGRGVEHEGRLWHERCYLTQLKMDKER